MRQTGSGDPMEFEVEVRDGRGQTTHRVTMSQKTFTELAAGRATPAALIEAACAFLLEREPKESILARFDVTVISRYLPEFQSEIGRYLDLRSATATVTIADDPPVVNVTATDPDAAEAGPDPALFTFTRSGGNLAAALPVFLRPGGSATSGRDYAPLGDGVTIPANQTSATLAIAPLPDNVVETAETVILTIDARPSYVIGAASTAMITIADDPPVVTVTATDPDASESGSDPGVFTCARSGGNLAAQLSLIVSRGGTATNGVDYAGIGGGSFLVPIPANQTTATVTISPVDDALAEGPETVILTIEASASFIPGTPSTATVTIADDD